MRTRKFNRTHAILVFCVLLLFGYLAFLAIEFSPKKSKEPVTLISSSNFEFSDLMHPSEP